MYLDVLLSFFNVNFIKVKLRNLSLRHVTIILHVINLLFLLESTKTKKCIIMFCESRNHKKERTKYW